MKKNFYVLIAIALVISSCSQKYYYTKGLSKAQHPVQSSVYNGLVTVTPNNTNLAWDTIDGKRYVLAATWKADTTYYTKNFDSKVGYYRYNTGNYPVFISLAPQLKAMELGGLSDQRLKLRLQQLLGLPPTANYSYFLELWVSPEDMFRPCFDPSIINGVCSFTASAEDLKRTDHMDWLNPYIDNSYSNPDVMKRYPFTHLGYTYDWSPRNKTHVGLSEFVIGKNKDIFVKKVYTTRAYVE
ncbi:hypothetical protein [Polluticoccus soli]|uniref:hypothetical protein n=1 Tax=Polluticoccus soli TaxID=3034150 RepID=UPI0023E293E2|nr:hypothetical protein [Flavipsychrobacter sp. JY13-12]